MKSSLFVLLLEQSCECSKTIKWANAEHKSVSKYKDSGYNLFDIKFATDNEFQFGDTFNFKNNSVYLYFVINKGNVLAGNLQLNDTIT